MAPFYELSQTNGYLELCQTSNIEGVFCEIGTD